MMDYIVIVFAKLLGFLSALLGGGTNLPGEIALRIRPNILKRLARGYHIVLITGTNGKTTTASLLQGIIKKAGKRAVSSISGANLKTGVAACLIKSFPLFRRVDGDYAVLEVDEAYMRHVTAAISPEVIAVTNLFPDQVDRYGVVDATLSLIEEACKNAPDATLVLNGDEPIFGDFMEENRRFYFGFRVPIRAGETAEEGTLCKTCKTPYQYAFSTFSGLGAYTCPSCGAKRPPLDLGIEKIESITEDSSVVLADGLRLTIPQAGAYNIYNALCAASCARALGISDEAIREGIFGQESKFGRQENVRIENAEVRLILIKNPAGAEEAIASILPEKEAVYVGVSLNDGLGDGTDVSWIYDTAFEKLKTMQIKGVLAAGTRCYDMAIRLKVAGLGYPMVFEDDASLLEKLKEIDGKVYLFVNYTAMMQLRKFLYRKKYIKRLYF